MLLCLCVAGEVLAWHVAVSVCCWRGSRLACGCLCVAGEVQHNKQMSVLVKYLAAAKDLKKRSLCWVCKSMMAGAAPELYHAFRALMASCSIRVNHATRS
eukprot:jgi/Chrzof1/2962/Cz12g06060.t1